MPGQLDWRADARGQGGWMLLAHALLFGVVVPTKGVFLGGDDVVEGVLTDGVLDALHPVETLLR